ncbi:flagellar export protein FliJ [Aliidiomarina minuta]|uniref:Flagellar FliJ protein n=1 Tax=Aliidiomarina minuta TaxID=880057 RepID=A0A432W4X4_9GAMM|nr:flagellar export protein FliJ [Aliidiomarina minuta]RUO24509.1 flagellar export protein FliJ [Aliidiomarina minuta]
MNLKALLLVRDMEKKREDQAAVSLQQARQQHDLQHRRLQGLEQYRLEYLNSAQERGKGGLQSMRFGHYHAFVGKLDTGIQQQRGNLQRLQQVVEQRQKLWMEKQQRRKAIDNLIEKHEKEIDVKRQKQEQKTSDEYAMQGFMRRRRSI